MKCLSPLSLLYRLDFRVWLRAGLIQDALGYKSSGRDRGSTRLAQHVSITMTCYSVMLIKDQEIFFTDIVTHLTFGLTDPAIWIIIMERLPYPPRVTLPFDCIIQIIRELPLLTSFGGIQLFLHLGSVDFGKVLVCEDATQADNSRFWFPFFD